jgi:ABC-type Na+ transport system ATPase subunit NatA
MGQVPVVVRGLVKRYGEIRAVDDVDLTVEVGDIYGYLGPNGAGKTTTLRMLLGLIRRDGGSVSLFGRDPARGVGALEGVGGFVESPTFYPYLSGRENLRLFGALDGGVEGRWIEDVLDQVELRGRARDRVGTYSLGMRQRLGIAAGLIREPRLLILDEPANGLDPAGIRDMRSLIASLPDRGVTVLYSSHLLRRDPSQRSPCWRRARPMARSPRLRHLSAAARRLDRGSRLSIHRDAEQRRRDRRHRDLLARIPRNRCPTGHQPGEELASTQTVRSLGRPFRPTRRLDRSSSTHLRPLHDLPAPRRLGRIHTPRRRRRLGTPRIGAGVREVIAHAKTFAGERDVSVTAGTIGGQALAAGLVDEVHLNLVPVLFASGPRFFAGYSGEITLLGDPEVIQGTRVTHLIYRID